jgi:hypothetical protein
MAQTGREKELSKPEEVRDPDTVAALTAMRNTYANEITNLTRPSFVAPPKTAATSDAVADTKPAPVGPEGFAQEQKQKAADIKKAADDEEKNKNERPADPPTINGGRIGPIPNPAFNDAEKYIAAHAELTGEQRAGVRGKFEATQDQIPKGHITVTTNGQTGSIPADQLDAFKKAHPDAVVTQ